MLLRILFITRCSENDLCTEAVYFIPLFEKKSHTKHIGG